jgi:hypothetical protein
MHFVQGHGMTGRPGLLLIGKFCKSERNWKWWETIIAGVGKTMILHKNKNAQLAVQNSSRLDGRFMYEFAFKPLIFRRQKLTRR